MNLRPCFKHLVLEPIKAQTETTLSKFVLPEAEAPEYSSWLIKDFADDCQIMPKWPSPPWGKEVVVLHHMVKKVVFKGQEVWIVPENAIVLMECEK